ncbi:MAG: glycoside hydrolase [Nitrosomonas sp.]|nr:glycoside hydrolase [Nitrosomonas sp.]
MRKILVNKPSGEQAVLTLYDGGAYNDPANVLWDEQTDGPLPDGVMPGKMRRVGGSLVADSGYIPSHASFVAAASVPNVVPMKNARLALLDSDLLSAVDAHVQTLSDSDKIHWQYATEIRRDHPLVESVRNALGWPDRRIDDLFIAASKNYDATAGVKFHPGHYYTILDWGRDKGYYLADVKSELLATPALRGVQARIFWNETEVSEGVYDFSLIDNLLAEFSAIGKRLVITLQTKTYLQDLLATPDYMTTPEYEGGSFQFSNPSNPSVAVGYSLKTWNAEVVKAFIRFIRQLGDRYNGHPFFEGICFIETTMSEPVDGTITISQEQIDDYYKNLIEINRMSRLYFPNTMVCQFVNYPRTILSWFVNDLKNIGSALGGPDVHPDDPGLTMFGNPNTPDGIYSYYSQLSGIVPLCPSVQPLNYLSTSKDGNGHTPTISELNAYARDVLHANYIFWTRQPGHYPGVLSHLNEPEQTADEFGGLNSQCPSSYYSCIV